MNIYVAISLGLCKIFIIGFFMFFLIRKHLILKRDFTYIFDTIIRKYFEYQSLLMIILFVTINLNIYDGIVVGLILSYIILWDYLNVKHPWHVPYIFGKRFKKRLLLTIKEVENKKFSFTKILKYNYLKLKKKNIYILYSLLFLLLSIILISYYFIRYDHYLFSSYWFDVLETINSKDKEIWFTRDVVPEGIYAFMNYLSHLTNSSPEITIYIYSIYQLLIVVITLFWFVQKMTNSAIIIPVFICIFYIIGFTYLPSNITNFYQSSSIHLSFTLVFPLLYYIFSPKSLPYNNFQKIVRFFIAFIAISLLDLYVFLFIIPSILLLTSFFYLKKKSMLRIEILFVYLLSVLISYNIYKYFLNQYSQTIDELLRKTLVSVESYFYNPFITVNIDKLLFYYQFIFIISIILNIILVVIFDGKWKKNLIFFIYISIIYILTQFNFKWLDNDLLYRLLSILLPIQTGLSISIVFKLFKKTLQKQHYNSYRGVFILLLTIMFFFILQQPVLLIHKEDSEILNEDILSANELILRDYLDRTYMVVNKDEFVNLSSGKRYFLSYDEFLGKKYEKQDSIYAKYINNNKYLLKHPEIILPSSVFIFVYKNASLGNEKNIKILDRLKHLKRKGRIQRLVFQTKQLSVYEIINKPQSSQIYELIF